MLNIYGYSIYRFSTTYYGRPFCNVSVRVKVLKLEVGQEKKRKRDVIVTEENGTAKVVLWEQHVDMNRCDMLKEGKSYLLTIFHVREYKGKRHLSMNSTIDNLMMKSLLMMMNTTIHHVTIVGVSEFNHYLPCHTRVEPQTPPDGKCTRSDCHMLQVFDMCPEQISAPILLHYLNDDGKQTDVLCSAYGDIVYHLANKPTSHQVVLKKFPQVQLQTGKNIITFALRQM